VAGAAEMPQGCKQKFVRLYVTPLTVKMRGVTSNCGSGHRPAYIPKNKIAAVLVLWSTFLSPNSR